ncbi:MAG TPA: alpha/beta fold hydrolase [Thermoanaerobaculia bacterium]|jgi:pimeloyl-ACP methyl ester carboxylesterase/DNA-binding CsgD family transcriptional regulator|nr:alpha/beta fold hydrolase [Thermoanaerobaculia bacterium]
MSQPRQRIRFLRTDDGVKLAWAEAGSGPLLVKAANWLTDLEFEWESPVWRHWLRFFSEHFRFVRYDERGCGLTDRQVSELSVDRWMRDLESVVEAARPEDPFALLGISQGAAACIAYAIRHPQRVSRMVLYGGYARGYYHRGNPDAEREYRVIVEAIRVGWGKENPAFRQLFTSRFIPEGTPEQLAWFNELCRRTTSADVAAALMEMRAKLNVVDLLDQVRVPTLVIHAREDNVVPLTEGRVLASGIRDAQFVELPSKNHVLLEDEAAWPRFQEVVLEFLGRRAVEASGEDPFASLSPREREILALINEGLGNAQIGERLAISEKTVRNHISNVYDKLGVWTRAQAMVFARDHGFRG